jgi:hypothetical protein
MDMHTQTQTQTQTNTETDKDTDMQRIGRHDAAGREKGQKREGWPARAAGSLLVLDGHERLGNIEW